MNLKNLKISAQLILGFTIVIVFVLFLGGVSNYQTDKISEQTTLIYEHPMKVQRAVVELKNDILQMRLGTRDLMLAANDDEKQNSVQMIEVAKADALLQFDTLRHYYLGPKLDVDGASVAFINWNSARELNNLLAKSGNIETVKQSIAQNGKVGILRTKMLNEIDHIDSFAKAKSYALYQSSIKLNNDLDIQLMLLVAGIVIFILIIGFIIILGIRNPIKNLVRSTQDFKNGNLNARSSINSKNEFGELAAAFNEMVESIKLNFDLTDKTNKIVNAMLSVDNSHNFFREMLPKLSELTDSQMAAVYLLNDEKTHFYHYESVGLDAGATKLTFEVDNYEGEFGKVLSTRKIQHVKSIPIDTTFVYQTVTGNYIPREIITIPILANNEIVAIISIASLRKYSEETNKLIDEIFDILTARIEGILLYRRSRKILKKLETLNSELEAQKTELESQSVELKEQNRELEIQKNQLHEACQLKTNFLSNMSHELRTPLNSVIALSGVLNRRLANKVSSEEYSYLEVIERNGKHLLALINDILDISRIEAGKEEVEVSKFSTSELVLDLMSMIEPQAKQKHIELKQKPGNSNIQITSDISKCRHILQNLIGNAVKFTETGSVEIGVVQKREQIEISVTDTGIGISNQSIEHIFDEFRQADASTSRRYGGTGLGLAIAKKYANLLGGTITVESVQAKGSTFTLTLPLTYSADKRVIEKPSIQIDLKPFIPAAPAKTESEKTILLIDDSEPVIIQMKDFLLESGYQILSANNGTQALEIVSQTIPNAIILDLMMPGVDGFSVLENIRNSELTAQIPVLILTAKHITHEDLRNLKRNNVHQLIQKGDVNRNELLQAVETMLNPQPEPVKRRLTSLNLDKKLKVLVVEDNPDNMITVKAIIGEDFEVFEAFDGENGFKQAKKISPDLILMDIALPGMDGIETLRKIRQTGNLSNIPIIALTASAMISDRETILAHGFDGYIAKPIDEAEFFTTIKSVLFGE